jgi:tRNA/rRNA methyltransferase
MTNEMSKWDLNYRSKPCKNFSMTETLRSSPAPAPAIVLIDPQMGENIGAAARAMLNFGLTDLRLVRPRDGWPSEPAEAMAAGALEKMPPVRVYGSVPEAVGDCHFVLATTARLRDMVKPVMTARDTASALRMRAAQGQKTALLFGGERSGLSNDDVALAGGIVTIPANPGFSSINLAQGVMLCAYEWFQAAFSDFGAGAGAQDMPMPATQDALDGFLNRLDLALDTCGFYKSPDMKHVTARNVRAMFTRAGLTEQEVRTFHGIITALTGGKMP